MKQIVFLELSITLVDDKDDEKNLRYKKQELLNPIQDEGIIKRIQEIQKYI